MLKAWRPYLAIILGLLLLFVYTQFKQKKYEAKTEPLFEVSMDDVKMVTIERGDQQITLLKNDLAWAFSAPDTGKPATDKINSFIKDVIQGQRENSVSDDTVKFAKYGIAKAMAYIVTIKGEEGILAKGYIGQGMVDAQADFIRYEGSSKIYPIRGQITYMLGLSSTWWR